MQDFATKLYKSSTWQRCREQKYRQAKGLCERCLSKGLYKPGEIVHHKIELTPNNIHDPDITLNIQNLQLLCRDCHAVVHKPEKRFKVDELGRVIVREQPP